MGAGVCQLRTGFAWLTTMVVVAEALEKSTLSVGMKVTESVCVPAGNIVPAAGEYTKVPGTAVVPKTAVASSCVAPRGVPKVIAAGCVQLIDGMFPVTLIVTEPVAAV